jgi:alkyl hydroperoxide reductase subunit AhpC
MKFTLPGWTLQKNNGGIEGAYPILADTNRNLSNILGILDIDSTEYSEETDSVMKDLMLLLEPLT